MTRTTLAILFTCSLAVMMSCDSTTTTTNPIVLVSRTLSCTPDSVDGYMFSFTKDTAIGISKKLTNEWDIRLVHVFGGGRTVQIDAFVNSGSVNAAGQTMGYVVDTTFDNVTFADASKLRADSLSVTGRVLSANLDGTGMFNYDGVNHILTTNAQKTLIVRTASGVFYKFQFVNLSVQALTNALCTFTFRYQKGDGSRLK